MDWLHINSSAKRLAIASNGMKKVFLPSTVALPAVNVEDEELREEAEALEAETVLDALDAALAAEIAAYEEDPVDDE
jgi:hypothetical protein